MSEAHPITNNKFIDTKSQTQQSENYNRERTNIIAQEAIKRQNIICKRVFKMLMLRESQSQQRRNHLITKQKSQPKRSQALKTLV